MQISGFGHGGGHGPGNLQMAREVLATRGWRGLFLGLVPTLGRDVPGCAYSLHTMITQSDLRHSYAVFFASYEFLKRSFAAIPLLRTSDGESSGGHGGGDAHGGGGLSPIAVILAGKLGL